MRKGKMKVDNMYLVETDHFKKRKKERSINLDLIEYGLRDKIRQIRMYRNLSGQEFAYKSGGLTIIFQIIHNTIKLITAMDKSAHVEEAIII